jgi:hypothetical protein
MEDNDEGDAGTSALSTEHFLLCPRGGRLKQLVAVIVGLGSVAALCIVVAGRIGASQPLTTDAYALALIVAAQRGASAWCWAEICPDDSANEVQQRLAHFYAQVPSPLRQEFEGAIGFQIQAALGQDGTEGVSALSLVFVQTKQRLAFWQALAVFGTPRRVFISEMQGIGMVCLEPNVCLSYLLSRPRVALNPRTTVMNVTFHRPSDSPLLGSQGLAWRGFAHYYVQ